LCENVTLFHANRSLHLRAPRSLPRGTTSESLKRLRIFELRARFLQAFHQRRVRGRGRHSKWPKNRQSRLQCSLPKHRSVPPPKEGTATAEREELSPLPIQIHKERRD